MTVTGVGELYALGMRLTPGGPPFVITSVKALFRKIVFSSVASSGSRNVTSNVCLCEPWDGPAEGALTD